jgi:hypothetical protein
MENAPVIMFNGRSIPSEVEEKFNQWFDYAYATIYLKIPGIIGIDQFKLIKKNINLPGYLSIYYHGNLNAVKAFGAHPDRQAVIRDMNTWPVEWFWLSYYQLLKSFRNTSASRGIVEDIMIANAPVVYLEGYLVTPGELGKYQDWFARWASRLYIPMLLKDTGLKYFNYFRLLDYRQPYWENFHALETALPSFMSLSYFENIRALGDFESSLEYAAFRRIMEVEFSGNLKPVWEAGYQLSASHRPQP